MDNFIVSARKYRPSNFESVVGQESITHTLQNAIRNNHLAQALLFCGPRGVGKTTCARILAKAINSDGLNKDEKGEGDEDFSFNIFELDAASNNSVDDIRNLIDQVRFPPQVGKFKVYIIDEVHMLSSQAFNAFLKTLEEPPPHAIFILATTEKHKILPTILSRCQVYDFNRIQINDIANHLAKIAEKEQISAEVDALHVIAEKADGALRDALSMFDQIVSFSGNEITYEATIENLNILDHNYYFKVSDAIEQKDIPGVLLILDEILQHGFDGHNFIVGLELHLRNLLVSGDPATLKLLEVGGTIREKYKENAGKFSPSFLLRAIEICNACDLSYKNSKNQRLLVELTLMQLSSIGQEKSDTHPDSKKKHHPILPPKKEVRGTTMDKVEANQRDSAWSANKEKEAQPKKVIQEAVQTEQKIEQPDDSRNQQPLEEVLAEKEVSPKPESSNGPQLSSAFHSKIKNRVSISSFIEEEKVEEGKSTDQGDPENMASTHFEIEKLREVWSKMAKRAETNGEYTLYSILNKPLEMDKDYTINLKLDNKAQEEEFKLQQFDILEELRGELDNYQIKFNLSIEKDESKKKAYTSQEKFKKMAEKNPQLNKLKDQFGLDINI